MNFACVLDRLKDSKLQVILDKFLNHTFFQNRIAKPHVANFCIYLLPEDKAFIHKITTEILEEIYDETS